MYEEYEARESPEAKVVKELDRFDVMLQAFQYERSEYARSGKVLHFDAFFNAAMEHVHHRVLRPMVLKIVEERKRFWTEVASSGATAAAAAAATAVKPPITNL